MNFTIRLVIVLCLLVMVGLSVHASPAHAELQPDQVVILANAKSPESLAVAAHYASRRGVPAGHIVRLDLPFRDTLTRQEYEDSVVAPLRRALERRHLASTTRVIVTTYGVPLRIEAPILSKDEQTWLVEAQSWVRGSRTRLEQIQRAFEQMTPGSQKSDNLANIPGQDILEMARTAALLTRVDRAWRAAVQHAQELPPLESERVVQKLFGLTQQYGGGSIPLQKATGAT